MSPEINGDKVLYYNDDLEELSSLGYLKYVVYPIKRSYRYFKSTIFGSCSRRTNESYYDIDEEESMWVKFILVYFYCC